MSLVTRAEPLCALHLVAEHDFGRLGGVIGRGRPHVGGRLRLGESDLRLRLLGAAGDEVVHPLDCVLLELLGLDLGLADDRGRVGLGVGLLLFEARQQRGRLVPQLGGLAELRSDRLAARVERLQDRLVRAEIDRAARRKR